ncbi:unnamed protein product, partial [Mycena citricolor]
RLPAGDPPPSPGTTVASFSTNTADMCYIGCVADRYTACQVCPSAAARLLCPPSNSKLIAAQPDSVRDERTHRLRRRALQDVRRA